MISKKKLTALAVASLFVTPVMAVAQETIYAEATLVISAQEMNFSKLPLINQ